MYYFAFGSNLNRGQMKQRCPAARPVGKLLLPDWRLTFRSVADIEPSPGYHVEGAVWRLSKECEFALDIYEGVSGGLYTKEYFKIAIDGVEHECLVYVMSDQTSVSSPWPMYLRGIQQGYRDFDLNPRVLGDALYRVERIAGKFTPPYLTALGGKSKPKSKPEPRERDARRGSKRKGGARNV